MLSITMPCRLRRTWMCARGGKDRTGVEAMGWRPLHVSVGELGGDGMENSRL